MTKHYRQYVSSGTAKNGKEFIEGREGQYAVGDEIWSPAVEAHTPTVRMGRFANKQVPAAPEKLLGRVTGLGKAYEGTDGTMWQRAYVERVAS